ncbi:MAG: glutathione S-transferase [Pseudomonadota bacterium]
MPPALPVLYSFRRCPYAMRARLALASAGVTCELREVVLAHKPQALRTASAKATVPVLVLPDGEVLEQSLDIMLWALGQNDPERWLMPSEGILDDMLALVADCDGGFKTHLDGYKYPGRSTSGLPAADHRLQACAYLQHLEIRLATSPWLFGAHATLADMAIFPFVRQFAHVDKDWFAAQPWPRLQAWLEGLLASPRFAQVMLRPPTWDESGSGVPFP